MNKPKEPGANSVSIKPFKPKALSGQVVAEYSDVKKQFGSLAITDRSSNPKFALHPDSKKLLGVEDEEKSRIEEMLKQEVDRRMQQMQEQARQEGFERGREEGRLAAEAEYREKVTPVFEKFVALLSEMDAAKHDLYAANERVLIQLIYQVSKQVLLRELKTDPEYIKRLSTVIIDKVGIREGVRLKINREDYQKADEIREFLKQQLPGLNNLQIDAADDLPSGGCKVETDLSRINASSETQLEAIRTALEDV